MASIQRRNQNTAPDTEASRKATVFNGIFMVAGIIGAPICLAGWEHHRSSFWLVGMGLFPYFLVSSVTENVSRRIRQKRRQACRGAKNGEDS